MSDRMRREILEIPRAMERILQRGAAIRELAEWITEFSPAFVTFAARGTSDNAALFGKYAFETLLGLPVHLAAPSTATIYKRSLELERAVVIGISQSGGSIDVCEYLRLARKSGALTVGITNQPASEIAKAADLVLPLLAGPEKSVAATKTYTSEMLVLLLLVAYLKGDRDLLKQAEKLPELAGKALATEEQVAGLVTRYRYMPASVVLGRGFNYATAQEFALKLMETCYQPVHSFSMADFLHGPIAMIHEGFPTFTFVAQGRMRQPMMTVANRVKGHGSELVVFTNERAAAKLSGCSVYVDAQGEEVLSPFTLIIPAQLFAYHLARVRGLDPDRPRGLTKVTRTR